MQYVLLFLAGIMVQDYATVSSYVEEIAKKLVGHGQISTVLLIGSYSRGDNSKTSDIDVVVISEAGHSVAELNAQLPESSYAQRVSLLPISASIFRTMYRNGNLFARHIVKEGRVIYDNGFLESIKKEMLPESKKDALRALKVAKERLTIYHNIEAFNNYHVYPASRLFSTLRQVVVAGVAIKGEAVFSQGEAVTRFLQYYPETRPDIERLLKLRPYALMVSRHRAHPAQPPRKMSASNLRLMVDSLERVVRNIEVSSKSQNH